MARAKKKALTTNDPMEEAVIRALTAVTLRMARVQDVSREWDRDTSTERFTICNAPWMSEMGPNELLAAEEQFAERAMLYWADKVNELRAAKNQPLMPATPEPKKKRARKAKS